MEKINILMFSNVFGGKLTFIHNELINLGSDFNVKYIALEEIENTRLKKRFHNYKIIPFVENVFITKIKWWLWQADLWLTFKNWSFARKLKKEVSDFKPDIIHLQFGYEALKFLDNCYDAKVSYIIHFHGYDTSSMFRKQAYVRKLRFYLSKENIYQIYVSNFIKSRFIKYNLDVARSSVIKCGIDLALFCQKEVLKWHDKTDWVFTQVSSQEEKKGIPYAIKGFSAFLRKNPRLHCKFYITGSPTSENIALVKNLGLGNHVIFTGLISQIEVQNLLAITDVFIHCSITSSKGDEEGIPTAIMESMAMRIPVISTYHTGIPELLKNNIHGILVQERNETEIQQALEKIIKMDFHEIDMHDYLIQNKYDLNSHIRDLEGLYYKLCK